MASMFHNITDGWFHESEVMWPGQRMSLKVKHLLHEETTQYQKLQVFDSETYGRVLVLDGAIQLTERDEFAYQEALAHVPLFSHPNPSRVLIIGGGDGGVLREVAKHTGVQHIDMCEIDNRVVEISKEFFPTMSTAFGDSRLRLHFADAAEFVKGKHAEYDVILVDSSDPVGPAESLFSPEFFSNLRTALRPGGIVCSQGECMWLHLEIIKQVLESRSKLFPVSRYYFANVPTYPCGQLGFVINALEADAVVDRPSRLVPVGMQRQLRYYSRDTHVAGFLLPPFALDMLGPALRHGSALEVGASASFVPVAEAARGSGRQPLAMLAAALLGSVATLSLLKLRGR